MVCNIRPPTRTCSDSASCLSRWLWSAAGERVHLLLQLRGPRGRSRLKEMSGIDRVQQGGCCWPGSLNRLCLSRRHEDIDLAAPCLPSWPTNCHWSRSQTHTRTHTQWTHLINWLSDRWRRWAGCSSRWKKMRGSASVVSVKQRKENTSFVRCIFRYIFVFICKTWIECELCLFVRKSETLLLLNHTDKKRSHWLQWELISGLRVCMCARCCKGHQWALTSRKKWRSFFNG